MKEIRFNEDKNKWLKKERGISFDEIESFITNGEIVDVIRHHNRIKHPGQQLYLINVNNYILVIPFVEEESYIFLKTAYFSRFYTKKYL